MIYLDNSATTKQYAQVTDIMVQYMDQQFGNPSSLYDLGITAEKAVKEARASVLKAMGKQEGQLFFTSGGTESDNMAIFGGAEGRKRRGKRIITSTVEHPAVLEACRKLEGQGFEVIYVDVDDHCRLNMKQLQDQINDETILITIMQVNNETGAVMPIDAISEKKKNALLHADAIQAFGKIAIPEHADMISISGHKIHGPKGIGALYLKKGLTIPPLLSGGGQENNMRSGTENVPAIAGLGKAAELKQTETAEVRDYLLQGIQSSIPDIRVNSPSDAVPSILNISFLGTRGEVILHTLEQDGIYISTGSACSSNRKGQSHVLKAMGRKEKEIEGALRFSFSSFNTIEEMDIVLDKLQQAVSRFRKLGSFR